MINECLIARFNDKSKTILFKNRDRAYEPNLEIIRNISEDIEYVYLHDIDTDWSEGMNSNGVGIVNSALAVGYDEKEKKIIKKSGKKSHDGEIIREALKQKDFNDSVRILTKYKNGVRGHTIISNKDKYIVIESTSKLKPRMKGGIDNEKIIRTNHGYFHINAGYTSGQNYLSSKIRKEMGSNIIDNISDYNELPKKMRIQRNDNPQLNPTRLGGFLKTTTQIMMNLTDLEFEIFLIRKNINSFEGIKKNKNITDNKIKIKIHNV